MLAYPAPISFCGMDFSYAITSAHFDALCFEYITEVHVGTGAPCQLPRYSLTPILSFYFMDSSEKKKHNMHKDRTSKVSATEELTMKSPDGFMNSQ